MGAEQVRAIGECGSVADRKMMSGKISVLFGRARLSALAVLVMLIVLALPGMALAAARYASPTGGAPSGSGQCTQAAPCDFKSAVSGAGAADGDTVMVAPGSYPSIPGDLEIDRNLTISGQGSNPAATSVDVIGNVYVRNAGSTVANMSLNVHGIYGFAFLGTLADRLIISSSGSSLRTCSIFNGQLRDSVCTSAGGIAVFSQSGTEAPTASVASLRNVTAYATGEYSYGLLVGAVSSATATVTVTNSIIRDVGGVDVRAYSDASGPPATVTLDHSNYGTTDPASPSGPVSVTPAGTGTGNQTAAPQFVNAGALDLHEAAGSPTIDAGTSSGVVAGERDADGNARIQGATPDIGAYEFPASTPPSNPVAAFSVTPSSTVTGQTISFDGRGSSDPNAGGSISTYQWAFGDEASASGTTTSHAFANPGTYTVTLTVTDNFGRSASTTHQVQVSGSAPQLQNPVAAFSLSPSSAFAGRELSFDGRGSSDPNAGGSITGYHWSLGDGASGSGATVKHRFARPGMYTVTLTVTDNFGRSASVTHKATAKPRPALVSVVSQRIKTARAGAPVKLACGRGDIRCSGVVSLTIKVRKVTLVRVGGHTRRRVVTRTVTLGSARFGISPNRSATVVVGLSRAARSMLRAAGPTGLMVTVTARGNADLASATVRLL